MFQNLLKTFNQNPPSPRSNSQTENSIKTQPKNNYTIKDDSTPVPFTPNTKKLLKKQTKSNDTPHFLDKLEQLGLQIDQLQQDQQKIAFQFNQSNNKSEKVSVVLSINQIVGEQCHPMIISNIQNNIKSNIDKLAILRIRNSASQLRQTYQELSDYIEDQKIITQYFNERLCLQFEDFVKQFTKKIKAQYENSKQIQQYKNSINSLEASLQSKTQQTQQLIKQLAQVKNTLPNLKNNMQRSCSNCKIFESKMQKLILQIGQNQQQVEKLLVENQNLQEYIFDMEQKIIGVDLEVERRLKENGKHLQEVSKNPPASQEQNKMIDRLQEQIRVLKQKCKQFDNLERKIQEINQRQSTLEGNELNLKRKESQFKNQIMKIQQEKEANYQREHQILLAEENLSKKISDLRQKQAQLSQWQADLAKKTKQQRNGRQKRDNTLAEQFPYDDPSLQHNSYQDLNKSDEISLKSFGRNKPSYQRNNIKIKTSQAQLEQLPNYMRRNYEEQQKRKSPKHYETHGQRLNDYPAETSKQYQKFDRQYANEQRPERILKRDGSKKFGESAYVPRSRENAINTAKYTIGLPLKNNHEISPYKNITQSRNNRMHVNANQQHQFTLPRNSPNHFRDASKNSRSSASKSIRGGFNLHNSKAKAAPSSIPRDGQLIGLGSKLQRLRQQIKKEIQSIK